MLTPAFEFSQDDESVTICIKVPYAQISETDTHFEDYYFSFYCKPYYLRINLPGKVVYCEEPPVSYNFDEGTFTIRMKKLVAGQYFEGLDLVTKLLAPKGKQPASTPLIEIIGDSSCKDEEEDDDDDDVCDWEIEQTPEAWDNSMLLLESAKCGFANLYSCSVFKLEEEANVIFETTDPLTKPSQLRFEERLAAEEKVFNDDHYLADLYEDEDIQEVLSFQPHWEDLYEQMKSKKLENADDIVTFSSEEKERMRRLPNKEYLLEKSEKRILSLGIIDILFGYAYNKRTTSGENTCESGWTINKLSATLSWLESFTAIQSVIQSCVRRSLCYPIYRHWELALTVLQDVAKILSLGRKYILKCFLEIHEIFCNSAPRYILNDMYITDYCIWIQSKSCKMKMLRSLAELLEKAQISKKDLNLEIVELEVSAQLHILELIKASNDDPTEGTTSEEYDHKNSLNSTLCSEAISGAEALCLQLKDLNVGDSDALDNPSVDAKISTKDGNTNASRRLSSSLGLLPISLDPHQGDSDSSSCSSESSSDSCTSTSCESDSDDCSSSDVDSDSDSSCSVPSDECRRLLNKDKCSERRR